MDGWTGEDKYSGGCTSMNQEFNLRGVIFICKSVGPIIAGVGLVRYFTINGRGRRERERG